SEVLSERRVGDRKSTGSLINGTALSYVDDLIPLAAVQEEDGTPDGGVSPSLIDRTTLKDTEVPAAVSRGNVVLQHAVREAEPPTANVNRSPKSPAAFDAQRQVVLEGGVGDGNIAAVIINGAARAGRAVDRRPTRTIPRHVASEVGIRDEE